MIEAAGLTNAGCVRKNNEDFFFLAPDMGLYIVADGMGGANAGEHASRLAAETVAEVVSKVESPDGNVLLWAFEEANRRVIEEANTDPGLEGMGTTLVAALENGDQLLFASVGDSRAYIFEEGVLQPITEDQTWVQEVGRPLGIDEASLRTHPMRHMLTMAIGAGSPLRVHLYARRPQPGTQILLCSDGLHGVAEPATIAEILAAPDPLDDKCSRLIEAARQAGGPDNITAVLLRVVPNGS